MQSHKHRAQCTIASCSLAHCLAESKSETPDKIRAVFLKKEPYWWNSDHLRDRPTDRQAVGPSLPAASIAAPIEGSKTSEAGTFRALGGGQLHTIFLQLHCQVMRSNTKLDRHTHTHTHSHTHTSHNCKNVIYANETVTGLIHIATNTNSCSVLHSVQRQNEHEATCR